MVCVRNGTTAWPVGGVYSGSQDRRHAGRWRPSRSVDWPMRCRVKRAPVRVDNRTSWRLISIFIWSDCGTVSDCDVKNELSSPSAEQQTFIATDRVVVLSLKRLWVLSVFYPVPNLEICGENSQRSELQQQCLNFVSNTWQSYKFVFVSFAFWHPKDTWGESQSARRTRQNRCAKIIIITDSVGGRECRHNWANNTNFAIRFD